MKVLNEYDRVVVYLDKISDTIRKELFGGNLEKPIITLQTTRGAYGHFETIPKWIDKDGHKRYEININGEYITRPIYEVIATLIHEYTHYYNTINGIKDVSRNGTYHNKRFKSEAEKHMILISYDPRIGWSITEPTEELINWCISHGFDDISIGRSASLFFPTIMPKGGNDDSGTSGNISGKKKSNSRKYECPNCGLKIRATKDITDKVKCICCDEIFVEVD